MLMAARRRDCKHEISAKGCAVDTKSSVVQCGRQSGSDVVSAGGPQQWGEAGKQGGEGSEGMGEPLGGPGGGGGEEG